jgi:hypothetical protein
LRSWPNYTDMWLGALKKTRNATVKTVGVRAGIRAGNFPIQFRSVYSHTAGDKDPLCPLQSERGPSRYGRSGKVRNALSLLGIAFQLAGGSASRDCAMNCTQCGKVNFISHCEFHDQLLCKLRLLPHQGCCMPSQVLYFKTLLPAHRRLLCVLYESQNKQRIFLYPAVTHRIYNRNGLSTARYEFRL